MGPNNEGELNCVVRCQICSTLEECNFSHCVHKGWPEHCGYTMRLQTRMAEEAVRAAVNAAFLPQKLRSWLTKDLDLDQ